MAGKFLRYYVLIYLLVLLPYGYLTERNRPGLALWYVGMCYSVTLLLLNSRKLREVLSSKEALRSVLGLK